MNDRRTETGLPFECRRHRAGCAAWDVAVDTAPSVSRHARDCESCRTHDEEIARMRGELRALAIEPVADLWPAIHARVEPTRRRARWPVVLLRAAGIVLGFGATFGALCALEAWERTRGPARLLHQDPFAALREPAPDLLRVGTAPEFQLLALITDAREDRR